MIRFSIPSYSLSVAHEPEAQAIGLDRRGVVAPNRQTQEMAGGVETPG